MEEKLQLSTSNLKATLLVALSAALFGLLGALGISLLHQNFSISTMLFWRFLIASVWIILWSALFRRKKEPPQKTQISIFIKALILGIICYAGGSAFYFLAAQEIGTGLAMVIFFTYPVFVVILVACVDKERISPYTYLTLAALLIGLLFIKGNQHTNAHLVGAFFALIGGFLYAIYLHGSKKMIHAVSSEKLTLWVCLSCVISFWLVAQITHTFSYPNSLNSFLGIMAIGILATALPIQLLLVGLKYVHPKKAAILSGIEPAITLLIGILFLHETSSHLQYLGVLIILISAIAIQLEK